MSSLSLLLRSNLLRNFTIIQLLIYFGMWFGIVGVYTMLADMGASALVVSFVTIAHLAPSVLHAPFNGVIIDRFKISTLIRATLLIEASLAFAMILIDSKEFMWFIFVLLYLRMAASGITYTATLSLLPKILPPEELKASNELHAISWSVSFALGNALGGIVVYYFGVKASFVVDGLFYLVAFVIFYKTQIVDFVSKHTTNFAQMLKDGIKYLKQNPKVRHLIFLHAVVGAAIYDTIVALLAQNLYSKFIAIPLAIGILNGVRSIGLLLGAVFLSRYITLKSFGYVFFAQSIAILIWIFTQPYFFISLAGIFCAGLFTTLLWSFSYTLIQNNCDEEYYGRVIAYNDMLFVSVGITISAFIGILADANVSLQAITSLVGVIFFVGFVYYGYIYKRFLS